MLDKWVLSLEKPGLSSWKVYRDAAATQTVQCSLLMGGSKAYVRLALTSCEQICTPAVYIVVPSAEKNLFLSIF